MARYRLRDKMPGTSEKVGPHYHTVKKDGVNQIKGGMPVYKKIEPGQVLECEEHEIRHSLARWERLSPEETPLSELEEPIAGFYVKQIQGKNKYNVIREDTHAVINDKPLSHKDALAMVDAQQEVKGEDDKGKEDEKKEPTTRRK